MVALRDPRAFLETPTAVPQIVIQAAAPAESNHDYDALFQSALSAQKAGDFRKAIALYTEAIELNLKIADSYVNRGAAYGSIGDFALELQDINTSLALEPKSEAFNNRGNYYFRRENYNRAIQDYNNALELNPANANSHTRIGVIHSLRDNHDNAIESFSKALQLDSGNVYTYLNRGASYNVNSDYDSADGDFRKVLKLDPKNAHAHVGLAYVSTGKGNFDHALHELDTALQLKSDFAAARAARAALYLEKGQPDRAIQDFDKVLAQDLNNQLVYNDRGVAYQRKGDISRAIQDYDRSLSIRPYRASFVNRGFAFLHLSQWDSARSDLLSARNMGKDLVSAFRTEYADAAAFEKAHGVKLPQDIADMISVEEPPQSGLTAESMREMFERIWQSVPPDAFDDLPTDLAKNKKHYLYGHPKEED